VVRLWCPRVYLDTIFESNDQELDSFIFHYNHVRHNDINTTVKPSTQYTMPCNISDAVKYRQENLHCKWQQSYPHPEFAHFDLDIKVYWNKTVKKWFPTYLCLDLDLTTSKMQCGHRGTNKIAREWTSAFTIHTNVIKITVPQNGGQFNSRAAIGRRKTSLNSYVAVSHSHQTSSCLHK